MNKRSTKDMLGRIVETPIQPKRIICLVPSITELLYDLGLREYVIGITKFCIKPESWHNSKTRVGGTKNVNFEKIQSLNPDLIIANKEENTKTDVEKLTDSFPVWISDINTYEEALLAIGLIGEICNRKDQSTIIISKIDKLKQSYTPTTRNYPSVLYLIWKDPYMAVGTNTYINDLIDKLGYQNCFTQSRYKEITTDKIKTLNPDYIFLSSEPYPFKEKHIKELSKIIPSSTIKLVDGELFSWYGTRLLDTFSKTIFI